MLISSPYCAASTACFGFFVLKNYLRHVWPYEMYQSVTSYIKWNYNFCLPPSWMWALFLIKLKKDTLRWPRSQDKITYRCVHVLGFVYGKQEEMPARVAVPSSCHRARGTASLCMNTGCVLQEDSSENDEVFKSTLFFPCGNVSVQLQTCTLFHEINYLHFSLHSIMWGSQTIQGWACAVWTGNQL